VNKVFQTRTPVNHT